MIILECEQRSEEWFKARLGIPTASNFSKIITASGKPSAQSSGYLYQLLAEYVTKKPEESYQNAWMQRGSEMEGEAKEYYSFEYEAEIREVGLIYKDEDRLVSISPDGLIHNAGLELKCPKSSTMASYHMLKTCPTAYVPQIQGSLWLTEFEYWDFLAYHPDWPEQFCIRVDRDEEYIKKLDELLMKFIDKMLEGREYLDQRMQ